MSNKEQGLRGGTPVFAYELARMKFPQPKSYTTLAVAVAGITQIVLGAGFRSNLTEDLSVGVAYEAGTSPRQGILDSRLTIDSILRF
jgi:hypothetical protein